MPGKFPYFKHPKAMVESDDIGRDTRIWANAHVMKGAVIGARCNVGENCFIESGARIGNDVVVKNNVAVWDGVVIEDGAFLGPSVVLTNDRAPRSGFPKPLERTHIGRGATIGANSTVVADRTIGAYAMVGAGSVVTHDVPPHRLVYGNPAREHGWVCTCGMKLEFKKTFAACACGRRFKQARAAIQEIP